MAGPEGFDFNRLAQQMGIGMGGKPDENAKPEDLSDFINKLFEKTGDWIHKAIGVNIKSAFNTGITAHTDIQKAGIQVNNEIMRSPLVKGAPGGALAGIVFGEVFKPSGAPTSSSAGGGDSGGGGGDFASAGGGSFSDYSAIASPSYNYEWSNVSIAMLGELSPPNVGRGAAIDTGVGIA
jgi:hypothetical protein